MDTKLSRLGVALMLGGGAVLMAAGPAHAAEVSFATECTPPPISGLPPVKGTTKVDMRAPATAKVGDEVTVVWKTVQAASKNPDILDLDKDTVKPTGKVTVGGAQTGTLDVEGPRQNPPIPKNSEMKLSDMSATLKLTAAGDVTLTPGDYNINVSKPISTDTKCKPTERVGAGATIKVTDGGSDSGGTAASGGTSGSSGGTTSTAGGNDGGSTSASGGSASGGSTAGGSTGGGSTGGGGDPDGTRYPGQEVSVRYECQTPIGDKNATSGVTIDAVKAGGDYGLTVKFGASVMDSPADIPADSVKPSMKVKVGGAETGEVGVEGPTNKEPIKSGDPIEIPDLKGTYKPGASGKVTLTPGVLTIKALGTTTTCTPARDPGPSLKLDVQGQSGGVAGGSSGTGGTSGSGGSSGSAGSSGSSGTSGTSGTSGSSGGLAETGASDASALHALARVAGTLLLLGGAVFTFTPWRRLRGALRR